MQKPAYCREFSLAQKEFFDTLLANPMAGLLKGRGVCASFFAFHGAGLPSKAFQFKIVSTPPFDPVDPALALEIATSWHPPIPPRNITKTFPLDFTPRRLVRDGRRERRGRRRADAGRIDL